MSRLNCSAPRLPRALAIDGRFGGRSSVIKSSPAWILPALAGSPLRVASRTKLRAPVTAMASLASLCFPACLANGAVNFANE